MKPQEPGLKVDQKTYNTLVLRKRMLDREMQNIKKISYHELIARTRKQEPILPPSPTANYIQQSYEKSLREAGFQDNVQEIAQKQIEMVVQAERKNSIIRRQMREAPIWSQIKRGKLGMDSVLILFGIFGSFILPFIFYHKFKDHKEAIIKSRKLPPEMIENLTEDSPVNIDQVSEQSIHYDNPDRRRRQQEMRKMRQKIEALKKDLDL